MKYFKNRQSALSSVPDKEMDDTFKAIIDAFDLDWLIKSDDHPIQNLWNRKDILSTNELYYLGFCIQKMSSIDKKWTNDLIEKIKNGDRNTQNGALFEILGLSTLSVGSQKIVPAAENNPGFDGTLVMPNGKSMRISIKNYGISKRNIEFLSESAETEETIVKLLKPKGIAATRIIIEAVRGYPNTKDWVLLRDNLSGALDNHTVGKQSMLTIDKSWAMVIGDIPQSTAPFHMDYNSYSLLITSPYHKNEEKNLLDKLDDACNNLIKHSNFESDSEINVVFIHLPESASIKKCNEWITSYFEQYPEKPLTGVILYQPTVSSDLNTGSSFIHHCFDMVFREEKVANWFDGNEVNFEMPVGRISGDPSKNMLIIETPDQGKHTVELNEKYIYQRGEQYLKMQKDKDGNYYGNINNLASGIFTNIVIEPFEGQGQAVIGGHFAPTNTLLIL